MMNQLNYLKKESEKKRKKEKKSIIKVKEIRKESNSAIQNKKEIFLFFILF
jgi:hypothetical protein